MVITNNAMKRTLRPTFCLPLLAALLLFAGCEKDGLRRLPVRLQPFSSGTKVYLDNTYTPTWNDQDQVNINGTAETIDVPNSTVNVTTSDATLYACYPAAVVNSYHAASFDITLPTVQTYTVDDSGHQCLAAPMAATGSDRLDFYNLCALVQVQVPAGMKVKYIDLATTDAAPLSGQGQVTFTGITPAFAFTVGHTYPYTRLDCGNGVVRADNKFYITVPAVSGKRFTITLCVVDNGHTYRRSVTQRSAASLAVSQYGPAVLSFNLASMTDITPPTNALAEVFSLGASTQVYFSKGNLQYRGSPAAWQFAPAQYIVLGADNSNIGQSYTGWIDLFGWGTTGQTNCSDPWESSIEERQYAINSNRMNNMDASHDWGANTISGTTGWRTPVRSEWEYLINDRPDAADKKAAAVVNGIRGLLLLPDYWILPANCTFTTSDTNRYNSAQWTQMQRHGALFLPAGGQRDGTAIALYNQQGWYWTSQVSTEYTCNVLRVLNMGNPGVVKNVTANRTFGCSVRLVKNRE